MRFFTVANPQAARRSLVYASVIIAAFQIVIIVLGIGAVALMSHESLPGGANMAAVHLASELGGSVLFGIVAAVTFATILAVVSGLTLAAASAISHDVYRNVLRPKGVTEQNEVMVSRVAAVVIGLLAIGAGFLFRDQNIGFLATLPLVLAASSAFPVLVLAMYWQGLTTAGAIAGGVTGLLLSIVMVILGPRVWVGVLRHAEPVLAFDYPTVVSLGSALVIAWLVSVKGHKASWTNARPRMS
jgi:cation/acetate symporter